MVKKSAGILRYRDTSGYIEVLLVHPGGPFWAKKDEGAWSIPKGKLEDNEDALAAAKREFKEETGSVPITGYVIPLEPLRQPSGKLVYAWAQKGDYDPACLKCNSFSMEWPPKSGRQREFPEIDRACWFSIEAGMKKILKGQAGFLTQLVLVLGTTGAASRAY